MSQDPPQLSDRFVIKAGRRGSLTMWVLALTVLWLAFAFALANAIAQRTTGDAGGVGHVFIPMAGIAFSTLALCVVVARWWEDETLFHLADDRLEVRHGAGPFHWPAVRMNAKQPVIFTGEGSRGAFRVFVEQDSKRVLLGNADAIVPLQYTQWAAWMRHHGVAIDLHWDVAQS